MKVLLFLNGKEGSQMGIEDGFHHLLERKLIVDLRMCYYEAASEFSDNTSVKKEMMFIAKEFLPTVIIFFHIASFKISYGDIIGFKSLSSNPMIVYDEGDMYGSWSKPITKSMKTLFKHADLISIRGLGKWYNTVKVFNDNVTYVPHSNSLNRFIENKENVITRKKELLFIGNKVGSRLGRIRRLPGAYERESFVNFVDLNYKNKVVIYGRGWDGLTGNKGPINFFSQSKICEEYWFHISFEHYPDIPFYFSDRLPIALATGQIYICHYHKGYEELFRNTDFIYFFKNNEEFKYIVSYLMSLGHDQLLDKSKNAKKWISNNLSPNVVWGNLLEEIKRKNNN
jgi:hypothetical protein